jgi:hypothetical protein
VLTPQESSELFRDHPTAQGEGQVHHRTSPTKLERGVSRIAGAGSTSCRGQDHRHRAREGATEGGLARLMVGRDGHPAGDKSRRARRPVSLRRRSQVDDDRCWSVCAASLRGAGRRDRR